MPEKKNTIRFGVAVDKGEADKDFNDIKETKKTLARPVKSNIELSLTATSVTTQLKRVTAAIKEAEKALKSYALETAKAYALIGGSVTGATAVVKDVGTNRVLVAGQRRLAGGQSIPYTTSVDITPQRERIRSLRRQEERLKLQKRLEAEASTPRIHPAVLLSQSTSTVPIKYVTLVSDISSALREMARRQANLATVFADPRSKLNTNEGSRRAVTAAITDPRALPPGRMEEIRALQSMGKQAAAIQTVLFRLGREGANLTAPIGISVNERNLSRIEKMVATYNRLVGRLAQVYQTPGVLLPSGDALKGQSIQALTQSLAGDVLVQVSNAFEAALAGTALRAAVFAGLLKPTKGFAGITSEQADKFLQTATHRPVFASGFGLGSGPGDWQRWAYGMLQRISSKYVILPKTREAQDDARTKALERLGVRSPERALIVRGFSPESAIVPSPLTPESLARRGPVPEQRRIIQSPHVTTPLTRLRRRIVEAKEAEQAAYEATQLQSRLVGYTSQMAEIRVSRGVVPVTSFRGGEREPEPFVEPPGGLRDARGRLIQQPILPFRSTRDPRVAARLQRLALFRRLQSISLLERLRTPIDIPGLSSQIIDPQEVLGSQRLLGAPESSATTQRSTSNAREAGSRIRREFRRFMGDERGTLTLPFSTDLNRSPVLRAIRAIGRFFRQFNSESARADAAASRVRPPRGPRGTYTRYNPATGERVIGIRPDDPRFAWPNRPISAARRTAPPPPPPPRPPAPSRVEVIDPTTGSVIYTTPQGGTTGTTGGQQPPRPPFNPRSTRGLPGGGGPGYNLKQGRSFSSAFSVLGSYAAAAFFIYGTIDAIREGITVAVNFEEEMLRLQGILRGKGIGDSLKISDAVIAASTKYGASLREVLQLTTFLVQSGRPLSNLARDLDQIVGSITGLGISVDSAKELVIAIRAITGGEIDVDIFDKIAVVQERAAVSAYDLAEGLKTTATIARELRGDYVGLITEVDLLGGAIGQIVTQTGVTGLQAATSLRNTISRLGRPEVIKTLQDVGGLKLGTPESGGRELRPIVEIFQELSRVYNQFKKEGRGAELQRLLVQLSGSRQTAALAAVLQNFGKVTDTAKASALAFGDAQTRTNVVLDATAIQLRKVSESFKAIGISFVQSGFGSVLRGLLKGISGIFSAVSSGGAAAELRIIALVAGVVAATRVIRTLGTTLYVALGARSTTQILEITRAAGKGSLVRNLTLRAAALARASASGTSTFARGLGALSKLLTPTGVILTGIALLIAGIATIYRLTQGKRNPLEVFQLDPSQLNNIVAPRLDEFKELVTQINEINAKQGGGAQGATPRGFFGQLRSTAEGILPTIGPNASRVEIVNAYTQALRNNSDVFGPWLDDQLKGLNKLDRQAKTIEIIMRILGQAAFVEGGVLQYGVRQLNKQIDEATTSLRGLGGTLGGLAREGKLPTVGRFGGRQGVPTGNFNTFLGVLRSGKVDATGRIAGLFELLANSIDVVTQDTGSQAQSFREVYNNNLRAALLTSTDKVIDIIEGVGVFDTAVQRAIGGDKKTEQRVVDELTDQLYRAAKVNTDLANVAFKGATGAEGIGEYSIGLVERAQQQLLTRAFRETGGTPLQSLIDILQGRGEGVRALVTSRATDRLTGVRNPITEFTQELFFTIKGLEYAEQAARTFGFSLEDTRKKTASTLQTYAERLVGLPLELYKQLADIRQKRAEQNIIISSIDRAAGGKPLTDAESSERENVNRQIGTYNRQERRILEQLKAIGLDERARNLLDVTRTLYTNLNLSTKDIDALVESFDANLGTDKAVENFFKALVEFFRKGLEAANDAIREQDIRPRLEAQLRSDVNRQILESAKTLYESVSSGALAVAGVGRRREATLGLRLQNIVGGSSIQAGVDAEQIRSLREKAGLETDKATRDRLLLEASVEEKRLDTIRQITLETEVQKEIYNEIYARQQQFDEQLQANLEERLSGLREVLLDFDKLTKGGALSGILAPIGSSFINRQATLFLDVFKKGGLLGGVGNVLGLAGEQTESPILIAHTTGAEIVRQAIISGHIVGIAAATGQAIPGLGTNIPLGQIPGTTTGFGALSIAAPSPEFLASFNADLLSDEQKAALRKQRIASTLQGLGSLAGGIVGTAVGGNNTGSRIGSQIGAAAGSFLPLPPGVGTFLGGVAGGLIGGLFGGGDDRPPPAVQALERIARNTGEQVTLLENTNKLLELQNIAFNVPSSFRLPSYGPAISAGQVTNEINVDINLGGTNVEATALGAMVANAVASELESQYATAGTYVSRIRY